MNNRSILSIDLGSAYTKVAARIGWDAHAKLLRNLSIAPRDLSFCVPSVVANVRRPGMDAWFVGLEAASLVPGEGVTIHRHWKARLFTGRADERAVAAELANRFLQGIRGEVAALAPPAEISSAPARLCVPKLAGLERSAPQILDLLKASGWTPARGAAAAYEPEANAMGVLTAGRNRTWEPPTKGYDFMPHPGRCSLLPGMLEPHLSEAFRGGALREGRSFYGVLVTDVGAYTTDFGFVQFDTSFWTDEWRQPRVVQQSYELGVEGLDATVLSGLTASAREAVRHAPLLEWERHKRALYAGKPIAFPSPTGGVVRIGEGREGHAIASAVDDFADRVLEARDRFCSTCLEGASVRSEIFTGGGALIPSVRTALAEGAKRRGVAAVHDPWTALGGPSSGTPAVGEREADRRAARGEELSRGACAIGGASVFFE